MSGLVGNSCRQVLSCVAQMQSNSRYLKFSDKRLESQFFGFLQYFPMSHPEINRFSVRKVIDYPANYVLEQLTITSIFLIHLHVFIIINSANSASAGNKI